MSLHYAVRLLGAFARVQHLAAQELAAVVDEGDLWDAWLEVAEAHAARLHEER